MWFLLPRFEGCVAFEAEGSSLPGRSPEVLWETALGQLELQVTRPNFDTWLRHTRGLRFDSTGFVVGASSDFAVEWLRLRMRPLIATTLSRILSEPVTISFEVIGTQPQAVLDNNEREDRPRAHTSSLTFDRNLTFDTFTVVENNRLAQLEAVRVGAGTSSYNPLILSGEPGLGKTHLLHAIAHAASGAGREVILLTGEEFVDRYGASVRAGRPHSFRDAYRECSLFLLDDLGFLASRPGSQEQFFHLFNTLHSSGRCVVMSTPKLPATLSGLSPHLRSRLQAGLTVQLSLPPAHERLLILAAKAATLQRPLPTDVLELIAAQPYPSIREFEGALNRVAAFADLHSAPPTLETARQALSPFHTLPPAPTNDAILSAVLAHFHLSESQLSSPSRARDITYARHIAMYLLRQLAQRPLAEIGTRLGNRDHSTVLSGYRRIARERDALATTRSDLEQIEAALERSEA